MMRKPGLIVPIRDRRAHKRILTLKNGRKAALAIIIFIAGLTINANLDRKPAGQFGRLYDKQVPPAPATMPPQPMPVVQEAPPVTAAPDPVLSASGVGQGLTPIPVAPSPQPAQARASVLHDEQAGNGVVIVGDQGGVNIVRSSTTTDNARPLLQGGIFRGTKNQD